MPHYDVISPEMSEIDYIPGLGSGPTVYFCCVCSVEASTKREAKIKAIKHPDMQDWVIEARSDERNPFSGLQVINPVCEHGICHCGNCQGECQDCCTCEEIE